MPLPSQAGGSKSRLPSLLLLGSAGVLAVLAVVRAGRHGRLPLFFEWTTLCVILSLFLDGPGLFGSILLIFGAASLGLVLLGVSFYSTSLLWAVWVLMAFLLEKAFELHRKTRESSDRHVESVRERLLALQHSLQELQIQNERSDRALQEFVGVFEATRAMSACLSLDEILACLSEFIHRSFQLKRAYLLIVPRGRSFQETALHGLEDPRRPQASRGSELFHPVKEETPAWIPKVLGYLAEIRQPIQILDASSHPLTPRLGIDVAWGSFLAMPLWVEGELRAALAVAGLAPEDFEKFLILAEQTSLELSKVELVERLTELAIIDGLTDTYVRRHFMERFGEELARSERMGLPLSLLMLDIDHFKQHNDEMGHLVGDVILKEVARLLKRSIREIDLVGRYGGEEFALLLPDTPKEGALQVAERIRCAIEVHSFTAYDESVRVTGSIGVASFPIDGVRVEQLIDAADGALYHAKDAGRNRVFGH